MIIAGYEYKGQYPFRNVYLTGIVRDKQGRKMSKSLGNSPDPIDLIQQYGADSVRTGMLFSSPAGNDLPYDEKMVEQGRNFCNKIWNAFRLVKGWSVSDQPGENQLAIDWFESRFNQATTEILDHFEKFRISDALKSVYSLIWDDFCAQYLEMVKPAFEQSIDAHSYQATLDFFDRLMRLAHPFMPFITEELWQNIADRAENASVSISAYPVAQPFDNGILNDFEILFEVVSSLRNLRNAKGISPKVELSLFIKTDKPELYTRLGPIIRKLANTSEITCSESSLEGVSFLIKSDEFFIDLAGEVDAEEEKANLLKDLEYTRGFLNAVMKKLGNERFVQNANPEVVEKERQKQADAESKIQTIEEALARLDANAG